MNMRLFLSFFLTLCPKAGLDPLCLSAVSYGRYRPVASNRTESARAKSRRNEIFLIERNIDTKLREKLPAN